MAFVINLTRFVRLLLHVRFRSVDVRVCIYLHYADFYLLSEVLDHLQLPSLISTRPTTSSPLAPLLMSVKSFVLSGPREAMHPGQPVYHLAPTDEYFDDLVAYQRRRKQIQLNDFSPMLITRQYTLFQAADYDLSLLEKIEQSPVSSLLTILLHTKKRLEAPKVICNPVSYFCKDLAGTVGMILGICDDGEIIVSVVEKSSILVKFARPRDIVMSFNCFFDKQQIQQLSFSQISHRVPVTLDMDVVRSFKTVPEYLNSESLNQLTKTSFRDYNEMRIILEQCLTTLVIRLQELKRMYIAKFNFCRVPCRWPFQFSERIQRFLNIGNNYRDQRPLPYEVLTLAASGLFHWVSALSGMSYGPTVRSLKSAHRNDPHILVRYLS